MLSVAPLVSVVTPTFNAGRFLRESIESVLGQEYPNIEYLVVDSHSTDDTQDILRGYAGRLRTIQADRLGPARAIHTGLSEARGSILAWLNADDRYEPDAVRSAVAAFREQPDADIVYGDAWWIDQNGEVIRPYPTIPFEPGALERECFISQPASFFQAAAYRECALDSSLPVSFDYDLWIRLTKHHRCFKYVPRRLASSRMHRECLTLSRREKVFETTMALLKKHYGYIPLPWIFGYLSYRRDGRDQFFEPLQYSASVFAASLPYGMAMNRTEPLRVIREWVSTAGRGMLQRLSGSPGAHGTSLVETPVSEVQPTAASRRV
jgi:glycosyltransferase involved in cell wall biosynthesis